jgi:transketolase
VVLADRGFFPEKDLETLNRYGSSYIGHPTREVNGVEPVYLRFGKKPMPHLPRADAGFELGKASLIREGEDLSFLACGETVPRAFAAGQLLANEGIQCRVLSLHTVKPLDRTAVCKAATETRGVITVEEHSVNGGLGEA